MNCDLWGFDPSSRAAVFSFSRERTVGYHNAGMSSAEDGRVEGGINVGRLILCVRVVDDETSEYHGYGM